MKRNKKSKEKKQQNLPRQKGGAENADRPAPIPQEVNSTPQKLTMLGRGGAKQTQQPIQATRGRGRKNQTHYEKKHQHEPKTEAQKERHMDQRLGRG